MNILCRVDPNDFRRWQAGLIDRLQQRGHVVGVAYAGGPESGQGRMDRILGLEARRVGQGLATRMAPPPEAAIDAPGLVIGFTGGSGGPGPVLSLAPAVDGMARMLAGGGLPRLVVSLDGAPVAEAMPMVNDRAWLMRGLEDVLARALTLVVRCVDDFGLNRLKPAAVAEADPVRGGFGAYLPRLAGQLAGRALGKMFTRGFYWQTGYRLIDGPGVAETGSLGGAPWTVLADDRQRFYADPFPFIWQGRQFLFVEEYPYSMGRGQVAVSEIAADGTASPLQTVLAEPFHLSYPQVFARDGEVWMLPETSAEKQLILYRAERMPDRWVRHALLLDGVEISDATLLNHGGRIWLFGSGRDGGLGSPSDTLMVYSADSLTGPWRPHRRNPILIDRRSARPGGSFVWRDGRLLLPVQDGTNGYGGGLGLAEVLELSEAEVRMAAPVAVGLVRDWPGIHTLNRAGRLEVIDRPAVLRK
jgi:hypothetical protein